METVIFLYSLNYFINNGKFDEAKELIKIKKIEEVEETNHNAFIFKYLIKGKYLSKYDAEKII